MAKWRGGILTVLHRMFCDKLTKFQGGSVEVVMGKSCPLNSMSLLYSFIEFQHLVLQQRKQDQFQLKLVSIDLKSAKKSNFLNYRLVPAYLLKEATTMNVTTECLPLPFLCQHRLQLMHSAICCPVAVLTLTYTRLHKTPEEEMERVQLGDRGGNATGLLLPLHLPWIFWFKFPATSTRT